MDPDRPEAESETLTVFHDAIDDLFTVGAPTAASRVTQERERETETDTEAGGGTGETSIVPLGPSLERYLETQKVLRRSKTTWNSLDMCFRWQLVCAYFDLHHPGALAKDAGLMTRVQRITRTNNEDGAIEYDTVRRCVTCVRH